MTQGMFLPNGSNGIVTMGGYTKQILPDGSAKEFYWSENGAEKFDIKNKVHVASMVTYAYLSTGNPEPRDEDVQAWVSSAGSYWETLDEISRDILKWGSENQIDDFDAVETKASILKMYSDFFDIEPCAFQIEVNTKQVQIGYTTFQGIETELKVGGIIM